MVITVKNRFAEVLAIESEGFSMNNNNNRQSINNYVYDRRRNTNSESVRDESEISSAESLNNSFSMYNSYVSENNYNSYISSSQQNSYSGYSQENITDNRDMPAYSSDLHEHQAVEIPLEQVPVKHEKLIGAMVIVPFALTFAVFFVMQIFGIRESTLLFILLGLFFLSIMGIIIGISLESSMIKKRLKEVCTVHVTGHLVGYASKLIHIHHKHRSSSYTIYAPKYEIFINNRYEIRTLDDFKEDKDFAEEMDLLANPNGYEIIPGGNGGVNM